MPTKGEGQSEAQELNPGNPVQMQMHYPPFPRGDNSVLEGEENRPTEVNQFLWAIDSLRWWKIISARLTKYINLGNLYLGI